MPRRIARKSTGYLLTVLFGLPLLLAVTACQQENWPPSEVRFEDNGDGTLTDTTTGLVWLKDGYCAKRAMPWWEAKEWAAVLEDGECGLSDGSKAGQWRLPEISEFCSAWEAVQEDDPNMPCPPEASAGSLIDHSVGPKPWVPKKWQEGDSYYGRERRKYTSIYWSATEVGDPNAWSASRDTRRFDGSDKGDSLSVWPVRDER